MHFSLFWLPPTPQITHRLAGGVGGVGRELKDELAKNCNFKIKMSFLTNACLCIEIFLSVLGCKCVFGIF